jgi:hypothetical protein
MKKLTMVILVLLVSMSSISVVAAETKVPFNDMKDNHWAKAQIEMATQRGYVNGYPDGTFGPSKNVTRAEFIKMVVDALQLPHSQGGSPWYQPYVAVAFEMKLLDNTDSKEYTKPINRLEIMRIVSRGLSSEEKFKAYFNAFEGLYNGDLPFTDYREFQQKDLPYIGLAFGAGVVNGYPDETMGLKKTATRAEAVVMIENLLAVRTKDPATMIRLQELKEVAETGMNVKTLSTLIPQLNLQTDDVIIEHKNFKAKLKRLYVIPFEGNKVSLFENKFIGGRKNLEAVNPIYVQNKRGYLVGVADVTFRVDGSDNTFGNHMYLSGDDSLFYYQEPRRKFGYEIVYPDEMRLFKKGETIEAVFHVSYKNSDRFINFQSNDATKGGFTELLKNPDAV